jgi:hypothetical protein
VFKQGEEGPDHCLAPPSGVLLVKFEDQFNLNVLFVIVPAGLMDAIISIAII